MRFYSQVNKAALPAGISHSAAPLVTPKCSTRLGRKDPSAPTGEPAKVVSCSSSKLGAIRRSSETCSPEESRLQLQAHILFAIFIDGHCAQFALSVLRSIGNKQWPRIAGIQLTRHYAAAQ